MSKWSHVGMIVYGPSHTEPMVYESTHCNKLKCFDIGSPVSGVQLVPLRKRLEIYKGKIAYRSLNTSLTDEQLYRLKLFRHSMQGVEFERDKFQMASSNYNISIKLNREDLSSVFCSELIAAAYQEMGLLCKHCRPSNSYIPKDFSSKSKINFINATLGPELLLN